MDFPSSALAWAASSEFRLLHFSLLTALLLLMMSAFDHSFDFAQILIFSAVALSMPFIASCHYVVLATGPGNPPAGRVWTAKTGRFSSRPVQKPDPLTLGGPNPDP